MIIIMYVYIIKSIRFIYMQAFRKTWDHDEFEEKAKARLKAFDEAESNLNL